MPYCSAGRPVFGERRTSLSSSRDNLTGRVALSVKPAAREMSRGRDNAVFINHEIGGGAARRPRADSAVFMRKNAILTSLLAWNNKGTQQPGLPGFFALLLCCFLNFDGEVPSRQRLDFAWKPVKLPL